MTILVEHDNSISGRRGISEDEISTLEDLFPLIQNYIQAGSCVYKLTILPDLEGGAWLEPAQLRLRRPSSKTSWKIFLIQKNNT